jgi:hypothetical protein
VEAASDIKIIGFYNGRGLYDMGSSIRLIAENDEVCPHTVTVRVVPVFLCPAFILGLTHRGGTKLL